MSHSTLQFSFVIMILMHFCCSLVAMLQCRPSALKTAGYIVLVLDFLKAGDGVSITAPMERKMRAPVVSVDPTDVLKVDAGDEEEDEEVCSSSALRRLLCQMQQVKAAV